MLPYGEVYTIKTPDINIVFNTFCLLLYLFVMLFCFVNPYGDFFVQISYDILALIDNHW